MGVPLLFGGTQGQAFDRTFFNVTLGKLLERCGDPDGQQLTLFLSDGAHLEVCRIAGLESEYVILHVLLDGTEACERAMHVVPYALIYRITIAPKVDDEPKLGFSWSASLTD